MLTRLTEGTSRPHRESSLPSSRDGTQRLQQTAWHCVIRPHWPPRPLLPVPFPPPRETFSSTQAGSVKAVPVVFYFTGHLLTPASPPHLPPQPPAVTAYLGSVLPSAFPLQAESEALPRTPTTLGQELQKHQAGLVLVSLLPLSLQTAASPSKTAGTLWELVRHAES